MAEHTTLVSSEVHEPKGISDSTISDTGKVITPSGAGVSELRYLTPDEVGVTFAYAEAGADQNTTPFSVSAASDPTLYATADYIALNSTRVPSAILDENFNFTFDSVLNALVPQVAGLYRISFWANVKSDTASTKVGFKLKLNGSWARATPKTDIKTAGRVQNLATDLLTDLGVGDAVSVYIASDKTASVTVQDFRFNLQLVKEA